MLTCRKIELVHFAYACHLLILSMYGPYYVHLVLETGGQILRICKHGAYSKVVPLCAIKAYKESSTHSPQHQVELSGQLHIPAACALGKNPKYPLNRRLGDPEPVWTFCKGEKFLASARIETPDHSAHSPVTVPTHGGYHNKFRIHLLRTTKGFIVCGDGY